MRWLRASCFLILFAVWVMSAGALASEAVENYVDDPAKCVDRVETPCAIRALGKNTVSFQWANHRWKMQPGTSVKLESSQEIRVLEGVLWIERGDNLVVRLGKWSVKVIGESWIQSEKDDTWLVKNLRGESAVKLDTQEEPLPVGFQNWYAGPGWQRRGTLRPIDGAEFWPEWNRLAKLPQKEAIAKILEYRLSWKSSVELSAELYQKAIQRKIASDEAAADRKRFSQMRAEKERKDLQIKFRQKFFNPDEK